MMAGELNVLNKDLRIIDTSTLLAKKNKRIIRQQNFGVVSQKYRFKSQLHTKMPGAISAGTQTPGP